MNRFLAALSFLTVLPVGGGSFTDETISGSVRFFPVVGLLLGLLAAGVAALLTWLLPPWPAAALLVFVLAAFSGGLHLDGLADTADGLFSSRPVERMLAIMRDSHVGTMGVLALVGAVLVKAAALASLAQANVLLAVALAPLAGRTALVIELWCLPYARPDGLARPYFTGRSAAEVGLAGAGLAIVAVVAAGWCGLVGAVATVAAALAWSAYIRARIRGHTGDTLGAGCELAETVLLLVFAGLRGG